MRRSCFILALVLLTGLAPVSVAQAVDDLMVRYSSMVITRTTLPIDGPTPNMYRHNLEVLFGRGPFAFGFTYQATSRGPMATDTGGSCPNCERGVMLTGSYDRLLSGQLRMEAFGRLGVSRDTDYSQPLYATDTDLRVNIVAFNPDGVGLWKEQPFFPSAYLGGIVNYFGRVQAIGGTGVWWNKVSVYLTGFYAFNGIRNPFDAGKNAYKAFGMLKNSGLSLSLSYDFGGFSLGVKRNIPFQNGSNDLSFALQYRRFFVD